jgi:putative DNA primase/helicase
MNAVTNDVSRIGAALACIPADLPRDEWMRVGAALKSELGDEGFDLFDSWSQRGESYNAADVRSTWRSLSASGGITINTLFFKAIEHGFDSRSGASPVDADELARRRVEREQRAVKEAEEREAKARNAATLAAAVWAKATAAGADHPYLMRKGVQPVETLREIDAGKLAALIGYSPKRGDDLLSGRALIAPVKVGGKLSTLEMIDGDGRKSALAGGVKAGGYWAAQPMPEAPDAVLIGEGVATALSGNQCSGHPAIASLSVGQLEAAARAMIERYPDAIPVMLADLDKTTGEPHPVAVKAAQSVGARLAVPDFGADREASQTDFNDMHVARGSDAVKAAIDAALMADPEEQAEEPASTVVRASDPLPEGYPGIDVRPCWLVHTAWQQIGNAKLKPGVYSHSVKHGRNDEEPELVDKWISSPLWVLAVTRNREDGDYGRLLEILSPSGKRKKWSMPMSMLAGDGNEVRAVLLSEGVTLDLRNRGGVTDYIIGQHPKLTMRAASMTGWHDGAFVLPDSVVGADDIWFQASGRTAAYASAGTFEGWQELAGLANGNPLLLFAMSAAFAGPLLHPLNIDGGGAHLFGDSSCGKTTALMASISAWGGSTFKRTWRATANGLEGAGGMHSDTLLALDEIGEIDPRSLYESAYALINGVGKTRANRTGEARQAARWRVFLLSTGELTVAARMAAGGIEAKAGQAVRILDVPVSGRHGVFDDLHGRVSGSVLSDEVRNLAAKHYGHAGPRFVEQLIGALEIGFRLPEALAAIVKRFPAQSDQEQRAARTFALCALAGEMSAQWGVTPWQSSAPTDAALHAFSLWRGQRGASGSSSEHVSILRAVADFIDRHGDSRFSNVDGSADQIRDRAGYWKQDGDCRLYLFTSGGLREATKGHDFNRALKALDDAGAIVNQAPARKDQQSRTPDGHRKWFYHVNPAHLEESA